MAVTSHLFADVSFWTFFFGKLCAPNTLMCVALLTHFIIIRLIFTIGNEFYKDKRKIISQREIIGWFQIYVLGKH